MAPARVSARRPTPTCPCPCCGHRSLTGGPGDYDLCRVCFWEDDPTQLRWPELRTGANGVSLIDAQQAYLRLGVMDAHFASRVRAPRTDEPIEDGDLPSGLDDEDEDDGTERIDESESEAAPAAETKPAAKKAAPRATKAK